MSESKKHLTTIFAVRTTIGRERTVQDLILNRLRTINPIPDLKAIITSEQYRGFVFIEAIHQHDVVHVTNNLIHVKGKVVGSIPFDDIEAVIKPEKVIKTMEEGDIVEITSGVFQNSKAAITKMPKEGGKEEVTVRLLDSDSSVTIKIHADFIKLIEKVKRSAKEYTFMKDEGEEGLEAELDSEEGMDYDSDLQPEEGDIIELSMRKPKKDKAEKAPIKVVITEKDISTADDDTFSFEDEDEEEEVDSFEDEETDEDLVDEGTDEDEDDWDKFMM